MPRRWRIARGSDLQKVLKFGQRRRFPRIDISWCENQAEHPRLGVIVPRYGRTAVRRNLVRRRLREYARSKVLSRLSAIDVVIWARPPAYGSRWAELAGDFEEWVESFPS